MNLRSVTLSVIGLTASLSALADTPLTDWYPVTAENRPFVRWWWQGSAVDSIGLTYNLEEFARQGLGGVEITPIYGVKNNEQNDIPYLSDRWMDMLGHTVSEANRLGLQVDMNNGTGWPFGGPEVTPEYSARKLITTKWTVAPRETLDVTLTQPAKQPDATLQRIIAVSPTRSEDITAKVKNGQLKWKAPKGKDSWTVYAIYSGRTYQKVKRAAPGGEGLVLNHYDSIAVKHYLDRFDRAFAGREWMMPNTFFNDSYEVYGSDWSDTMLDEFYREHGYRLELRIADFLGDNGESPERGQLLHDYRMTLGRLLEENFTKVWTDWAHSHGARIRNQSHGSPANIIDLYARVDIPECESFGHTDFDIPGLHCTGPTRPSDSAPSVLKFASSGAHLAGKKLTSAETLTWLTEHFHTSLALCKPEIDQMLCSGVNHIYFHGATYSPKDAAFPGRLFYASINMSPTSAMWRDASGLFNYIARVQSFMSAGRPDNDVLLYFPYEELVTRQKGNHYLMFDIHKMERVMPDVKQAVADIIAAGYDVDYLSDRLIDSLTVMNNGRVVSRGGNEYRAVVVPEVEHIPAETVRKLREMEQNGAKVIFTSDISKSMAEFDAPAEPLRSQGLSMIRRVNEAGGHNYFISVLRDTIVDGWLPLATEAGSVMLFDPMTGVKGVAESRPGAKSGYTDVRMQMMPGKSLLVKTFPGKIDGEKWNYIERKGSPVQIAQGWSIEFPESDPVIDGVFVTDTLTAWTNLPDDRTRINRATGRYKVTFTVDNPAEADDWVLELGDVRESARVSVNGQDAGCVWSVPMTINIGHLLRPGENQLTIDVTNLQANRIADYERRGVEWRVFKDANIASVTNAKKFSFGDWEVVPSGLNSTVNLIPVYYSK
ncbi:MAG: glycosyl hydrolase family 2 [Duncaniella sp.]|nr:glycosyl hydrolase family 2 [Duncaniella sp.]